MEQGLPLTLSRAPPSKRLGGLEILMSALYVRLSELKSVLLTASESSLFEGQTHIIHFRLTLRTDHEGPIISMSSKPMIMESTGQLSYIGRVCAVDNGGCVT